MNYYRRYVGDYMRDTGHLSLVEHGVYTVLLDHYYSTGQPLPGPVLGLYRICRAMDETEQAAVRSIAEAFFPVTADGARHNRRADEEIAGWQERAEMNRDIGNLGGRPRKASLETQTVSKTVSKTKPKNNPLQPPTSRSQSPEQETPLPSLRSGIPPSGEKPKKNPNGLGNGTGGRHTKRMPADYAVPDAVREWARAKAPDVDLDAEVEAVRDYEFHTAHSDWDAVIRGWCRREQKAISRRRGSNPEALTKFDRLMAKSRESGLYNENGKPVDEHGDEIPF